MMGEKDYDLHEKRRIIALEAAIRKTPPMGASLDVVSILETARAFENYLARGQVPALTTIEVKQEN